MKTASITNTETHHIADFLQEELSWFYKVLDTRIKIYFGHECEYDDVDAIAPPHINANAGVYGYIHDHYQMNTIERIVFCLALVVHIKPQMLDLFFTRNKTYDREFTEFGGYFDGRTKAFIPTVETALFIIAGDDLKKRIDYSYIFEPDHFFQRHSVLNVDNILKEESVFSGVLSLHHEIIDLIISGCVRSPKFGSDFPARELTTVLEWEDLVLDQYVLEQILEIKSWITYSEKILTELELYKKIKPGFRALFYGPSGTGKTLTATLLGKITKRKVFCVDLSMVISKYIGETEKNLEKIFMQAEHKNWILFFDEADALFGKRTNVNDAHDRFANQEVSYLLQRVEGYNGVVILASNMRANLDEAFTRRFQSIIHFPMPGVIERQKLWEKSFSTKTIFAADVDLKKIAHDYELTGGSIINIVRFATLRAVERNENCIKWYDIKEGIRREFQKEGRTF